MSIGKTADEKFLIQLYKCAHNKGDLYKDIEIKEVQSALRQKDNMVKTIVRDLAQCNFIKKMSDTRIRLTDRGIAFVRDELESS